MTLVIVSMASFKILASLVYICKRSLQRVWRNKLDYPKKTSSEIVSNQNTENS